MKPGRIVFFLVLITLCLAFTALGRDVPANAIYGTCGRSLFEQDSITKTDAYKNSSTEDQGKMLENHFGSLRSRCCARELGKSLALLLPAAALYGAYTLLRDKAPVSGAVVVAGAAAVGAAAVVGAPQAGNPMELGFGKTLLAYTLFGKVFERIGNFVFDRVDKAWNIGTTILFPPANDLMATLEREYIRKKPHMPPQMQKILEERFIEARMLESQSGYVQFPSKKPSPIEFATNMLALPTEKIELSYNATLLEEKLGTYDPVIFRQFKRFAARHAAASAGETVKKLVAYLEGPPGVGKTRAAENIAKALGVPFYVIQLGKKTVAELEGDKDHPGLFLEALLNAKVNGRGAKNLIISFDEIDRALGMAPEKEKGSNTYFESNSRSDTALLVLLLALLEPSQKTFHSPYLGVDIDISNVGFILTGNFEITDEALRSRFEIIKMAGYTPAFKYDVVEKHIFQELLAGYSSSKQPLNESDFSKGDWAIVSDFIDNDQDLGFREVIKFLQNLMDEKVLCIYYGECENALQIFKKP